MISFGARTNEIHHDLVIIEIYPNVSALDSMKLVLDLSDLLQEIFGGVEARTSEMDTNFGLAMLYRPGYWIINGSLPNHLSSQNLTCDPSFTTKDPYLRNSFLIFKRLAQK